MLLVDSTSNKAKHWDVCYKATTFSVSVRRCDAVVMPGMLLVLHCNRYLKNVFGHHETVLKWKGM